jgi:hypothetical protein
MFKRFYIQRNLNLYNEIRLLIADCHDASVTDRLTIDDIRLRINDDYKDYLLQRKSWKLIREDNVLLTALRDELKRLKNQNNSNSKCG